MGYRRALSGREISKIHGWRCWQGCDIGRRRSKLDQRFEQAVRCMSYSLQIVVCAFLLGLSLGALLNSLLRRHRIQQITEQFEAELHKRLMQEREQRGYSSARRSASERPGYDA
jgi:hypothetical protein